MVEELTNIHIANDSDSIIPPLPPEGVKKWAASPDLQGWLGFRSFRMRLVLMLWVIFLGMTSHVFKQSYAMAAESRKVPLEIFFNPTILSDHKLFSEFFDFFTPSLLRLFPAGGRQRGVGGREELQYDRP
jgi:hypothetical protein